MRTHFYTIDWIVLIGYFIAVLALGLSFYRRSRSSDQFTAGGRSLPGVLCGLSIFATYLSSISFLALPGKSYAGDWNPFVFSIAIVPAAVIALRWFLPYYRKTGDVSAYAALERRFGPWARVYASSFYLLYQIARMGVVLYLTAIPMAVIFDWDVRVVIVVTGVAVTFYSFVGGIVAVIWADAVQAVVLTVGAIAALVAILIGLPEGPGQVFEFAEEGNKFSLGGFDPFDVKSSTFWVVLAFGFAENLKNFGIDQSYIQRYLASRSEAAARTGLLVGALSYLPVSALFFFIGTSLFAFYETHPEDLAEVRQIVARQKILRAEGVAPDVVSPQTVTSEAAVEGSIAPGEPDGALLAATAAELKDSEIGDRVFPYFIAKRLPPGLTGLLIAAVFAAAMSTVSTSLNSSATLVMSDFYRRFLHPEADERRTMLVLYGATIVWGAFGTCTALALVPRTESALSIWWTLSSVLSGGILGLFLLGLISRRAGNVAALAGVFVGTALIGWIAASNSDWWPPEWSGWKLAVHTNLAIVFGTLAILVVGVVAARIVRRPMNEKPADGEKHV